MGTESFHDKMSESLRRMYGALCHHQWYEDLNIRLQDTVLLYQALLQRGKEGPTNTEVFRLVERRGAEYC